MDEFASQKQHEQNMPSVTLSRDFQTARGIKPPFSFKAVWYSWQSLDSEYYGSWPVSIKIAIIFTLLLVIMLIGYAIPISHQLNELKKAENQQGILLEVHREKVSKVSQLNAYLQQVGHLESQLQHQLLQLPQSSQDSELMESIHLSGINNDNNTSINFQDISIEPEIEQDVFFEQPIRVVAEGDYHNLGLFLNNLTQLPRIVTLHDFEVVNTKAPMNNFNKLTLVLNIKSYRSKADPDNADPVSTTVMATPTPIEPDTANNNTLIGDDK